jgi:hypothetical protein
MNVFVSGLMMALQLSMTAYGRMSHKTTFSTFLVAYKVTAILTGDSNMTYENHETAISTVQFEFGGVSRFGSMASDNKASCTNMRTAIAQPYQGTVPLGNIAHIRNLLTANIGKLYWAFSILEDVSFVANLSLEVI